MPTVLLNTPVSRAYQLICANVISKARFILQDRTAAYRNPDDELIGWINDAINAVLGLFPALFAASLTHSCVAGHRQTVVNARAVSLIDVVGVPACDPAALTDFLPGWQTAPQGATVNWMRVANDPLSFECYPPAPAGQALPILAVVSPDPLEDPTDVIPLPEAYEPALVDYIVAMVQMKDDEAIDFGRQQQALANFTSRIRGA